MKIDVLIIFEHIARELESALLLERLLKNKGLSVKIVQASWGENISHLLYSPKIVVAPWCYDDKDYDLLTRYRGAYPGNRFKLLNLHCEQLASPNAQELLRPKGTAKEIYHIAWGAYFVEELKKAGVPEAYIKETGSSRLDFFRAPYKAISKTKEELAEIYGIDSKKKWVLLIGNFSAASFSVSDLQFVKEKGYKGIDELAKIEDETYFEILKWFETSLKDEKICREVEFIYRPHPSELASEGLLNLEKKYANLHVNRDLSVRDWIVNSELAFSWCSTSSVEVAAAGVPIFSWKPMEVPNNLRIPLLENIETVKTNAEYQTCIRQLIEGDISNVNQKFREEIAYYYGDLDKSATEATVAYIEEILKSDDLYCKSREAVLFGIRKTFNYFMKRIMMKFGILSGNSKYKLLWKGYASRRTVKEYRERVEQRIYE